MSVSVTHIPYCFGWNCCETHNKPFDIFGHRFDLEAKHNNVF